MNILDRNKKLEKKLKLNSLILIKGITEDNDSFIYERNGYLYESKIDYISRIKKNNKYVLSSNILIESRIKYVNSIIPQDFSVKDFIDNKYIVHNTIDNISFKINVGDEKRIVDIYNTRFKKQDEFLIRANEIWGDEYSYNKVKTNKLTGKIIVTCNIHGDFETEISNFLRGHGCPDCACERNGWTLSKFINACAKNGNDLGCFYAIQLYPEELIKIGITSKNVNFRYGNKKSKIPYNYKILSEHFDTPEKIFKLEKILKRECRHMKTTPSLYFKGMHEVYNKNFIKKLAKVQNILDNM